MAEAAGGVARRCVLNVGGNSKAIAIPPHYDGWEHHLLDIDPAGKPDIVCDARKLDTLAGGQYDSVYCSHNLEHYFAHEVPRVLRGFLHVLKPDGFVDIRVPDIDQLMKAYVAKGLDITDVLYQSSAGPITVRDVLYGYGKQIATSGHDFFAHKTGFTPKSLQKVLVECGFSFCGMASGRLEIRAVAFRAPPTPMHQELLGLRKVATDQKAGDLSAAEAARR